MRLRRGVYHGSAAVGIVAGLGAGVAMSLVFGFLTQTLVTNQVATGLALTLFGLGVSGLIGEAFTGTPGGEARRPSTYPA